MASLMVPVPGRLERLAADLQPHLAGFERVREHHLVCKRFESPASHRLHERVRRALADVPAVEARATAVEAFENPMYGPGPVVYLAVESPGLVAIHERLVGTFGAVAGVEGEDYVPHVTLARDGPTERVRELRDLAVDPVTWRVSELALDGPTPNGSPATVPLSSR